ncbi:MAG TPA: phosphatidylglycerophosphatase A [Phycisphaerales bacterium]|nr:phosphatidylglycerophosphatase A [Phycisphaerales bacterium]
MKTPTLPFLTTFGLGRLRPAPGTWGSLPPPAIAYLLILTGVTPSSPIFIGVFVGILVFFSAACVLQGDVAEAVFGKKDHGSIVADETAGQCLPLLALWLMPCSTTAPWLPAMLTLGGAFLAFRLMDIVKPPPAGSIQRLPAGWGVLIDDLVAGVYAAILMVAIGRIAFG